VGHEGDPQRKSFPTGEEKSLPSSNKGEFVLKKMFKGKRKKNHALLRVRGEAANSAPNRFDVLDLEKRGVLGEKRRPFQLRGAEKGGKRLIRPPERRKRFFVSRRRGGVRDLYLRSFENSRIVSSKGKGNCLAAAKETSSKKSS